jgi:putative two-component system response regulator
MHDIGKVGIPDHIMYKKGALDDLEWRTMREHTILGARILEGSSSPYLQMGEKIAMFHHERWDGTGYPQGVTGDAIPVSARITTIADQYDALRSQRPYKQPFSHEESIDIILNGDGRTQTSHFDPEVLDAFRRSTGRFQEIFADTSDDSPVI